MKEPLIGEIIDKCKRCKHLLRQYGLAAPRCSRVCGTNCTYAVASGKCCFEETEDKV